MPPLHSSARSPTPRPRATSRNGPALPTRFARPSCTARLAFGRGTEGEAAAAQRFVVACAPGLIAGAHDTAARLRAAQALLVDHRLDGERLAREAVELSERTDDLNLQAAMHLTLARISGD